MTASAHHISGTDRYFANLLQHLPDFGIAVPGMLIGEPRSLPALPQSVVSFANEGESRLRRWRGGRRAFRELVRGADLIVSHGQAHAFPVLDLMGALPLVVQFHGPWYLEARAYRLSPLTVLARRIQEASVYRRTCRFITLSDAFASILVSVYGISETLIRTIPGGVDATFFAIAETRDQARAHLDLPLDRPLLLTTRRFDATKGMDVLMEAMTIVRRRYPDVLLAVTDGGIRLLDVARIVAERGLAGNVRFCGHVDDASLARLYRAADVSVVPSLALEGFGLSVLESLASGTPAVVSDAGGLPEVVRGLDAGLVVRAGDAAALADRLVRALSGEVPSAARCQRYARDFDWPVVAGRVAEVYREAVAAR